MFEAQAFRFECRTNLHEYMVALDPQCFFWGLGQIRIGFQGFMKHFHFPPFFVGRGDRVIVTGQISTNQIQNSRTAVFACKDLAD